MCTDLRNCAYQGASVGQQVSGYVKVIGLKIYVGQGTIEALDADQVAASGTYDIDVLEYSGHGTFTAEMKRRQENEFVFAIKLRGDFNADYDGSVTGECGEGKCVFSGQFSGGGTAEATITPKSGGPEEPSLLQCDVVYQISEHQVINLPPMILEYDPSETMTIDNFLDNQVPYLLLRRSNIAQAVLGSFELDLGQAGVWSADFLGNAEIKKQKNSAQQKCVIKCPPEVFRKILADPQSVWDLFCSGAIEITHLCAAIDLFELFFPNTVKQAIPLPLYNAMLTDCKQSK